MNQTMFKRVASYSAFQQVESSNMREFESKDKSRMHAENLNTISKHNNSGNLLEESVMKQSESIENPIHVEKKMMGSHDNLNLPTAAGFTNQ
jgi:hypothetical protein